MLDLKSLIIGFILAIVLYFAFYINGLGSLGILSFFIAAAIGGYVVGSSPKLGAVNGAIIASVSFIVVVLLLLLINSIYPNPAVKLIYNAVVIIGLIIQFVFYAIVGTIGGIIGAMVKIRIMENQK